MAVSKKKLSLFALIGLVVVLPVLLFIIKQSIRLTPRAANGTAQIYFASNSYTLAPSGTVSVLLDPAGNLVGFAEIQIDFDKTKVQLTADPVIPGGNPLATHIVVDSKDTANANGMVTMTLALPPGTNAPTSPFEYAELSFAAVGSGSDSTDLSVAGGKQLWETGGSAVPYTTQNTTLALNPVSATIAPSDTPAPTDTVMPGQPTNTLAPTVQPTSGPGPTNSCGGTCGSNSNCNAGLVCYAGYCRIPECANSTSCTCAAPAATSTPTPIPTSAPYVPGATSTPIPTPTTQVVNYNYGTATPTISDNPFLGGTPRTDVTVPQINYQTTTPTTKETWWQALLRIIHNFLVVVFGVRN